MIAFNDDFRGEWTSASAAEYDALCPGRHQAQQGLPEPAPSEEAASGTKIHAALERGDAAGLTSDEAEVYEACIKRRDEILEELGLLCH